MFGFTGVFAVAAILFATTFLNENGAAYEKQSLTFNQDPSGIDAQIWLDARYFDPETGEKISPEKLREIQKAIDMMPRTKALNLEWIEHGPDNIGGRTRAVLIDRTNNNRLWAGSVSGGLFSSTTRASSWSKVESYPGSKYISSMTQLGNGTIVVSTGSLNEGWNGDGVRYSTDFGNTWNLVPGTDSVEYSRVTEVVCAPNSNKLWLATSQGLKYWDFGAPFMYKAPTTPASGACFALKVSDDGQHIVAAIQAGTRTFVSNDGGLTFEPRYGNGAGEIGTSGSRIEYAISKTKNSNNNYTMYASRTSANLVGMDISLDNGVTWSNFVGTPGANSPLADMYRGQGTYNTTNSVDPTDSKNFFIGGIDIWNWKQTSNNPPAGGFDRISFWAAQPTADIYVHADNHEMQWDASNRFYIGNDGGIGISDDKGESFFPSNRGYNVTQFYGIGFDRNGAVIGGAQDNGTLYNNHSLILTKNLSK